MHFMPDITRLHYPVDDTTLDNGLRVVTNPDPLAPGVAVNLWYRVGSADEAVGATGFAHLFEHLMFAGSTHVASGEHLAQIQAVGGSANATTSFDRTNFFETIGTQATELALWLEADRMAGLDVDQHNLDTQREVVKEEKRQRYDNVPYGDQLELLLQLNFPEHHPYAHSAIGSMTDLDAATLDDVQAFYRTWYQPGTAVLTLSGALSTDQGREWADRYFGHLPGAAGAAGAVNRQPDPLPPHHGLPELVVHRDVPRPMIELCWRTPALDHPDRLAVEVLFSLLSDGMTSRLYRQLVRDRELAEAVGADDFGLSRGTSLGMVAVRAREGVELARIDDAVLETIIDLAEHGPRDDELAQAKAGFEREWLSALAPIGERADQLSYYATLFDDPGRINRELAEIEQLETADITRAAARWLDPAARATLRYEVAERNQA